MVLLKSGLAVWGLALAMHHVRVGDCKEYPSNCVSLEDGIYEMQLMDDDSYPLVNVKCYDGYAILDYKFDSNLREYFTSWDYWHRATVGPSSNEIHNWHEWYVPDGGDLESFHNFLVSPDCESCEYVSNRQLYGDQTTYWMTGTFFGCYWRVKANSNCDMDYDSLDCYSCDTADRYINDITSETIVNMIDDDSTQDDYAYTGLCTHNVRPAGYYKPETQESCTTSRTDILRDSQNLKPSLGTNGQYCVCVQPKNVGYTDYFDVEDDTSAKEDEGQEEQEEQEEEDTESQVAEKAVNAEYSFDDLDQYLEQDILQKTKHGVKISNSDNNANGGRIRSNIVNADTDNDDDDDDDDDSYGDLTNNVIELWQKDFKRGTYRIQQENTRYVVMEDIVFDFNPSNDAPNDLWSYWPLDTQYGEYKGARDYRDEYSFGFFAGVAIECDDVILDLNGFSLSMSKFFYLQQPWFTIVELSQQYFLPGQSFGFFGADPHLGSKIVIKDGVLGLSSHHGVHGNSNGDIVIKDVKIRDFNTHGIQLNGFTNVLVKNVDVGPSSQQAYLNGQWGIARVLRRRWQHIAEETMGQTLSFNRKPKMHASTSAGNSIGSQAGAKEAVAARADAQDDAADGDAEADAGGATQDENVGNVEPPVSMQDIVNELTDTMEFSWDYVVSKYGVQNNAKARTDTEQAAPEGDAGGAGGGEDDHMAQFWDENKKGAKSFDFDTLDAELFDKATNLFINPSGIPNAASIHGIFLNKFGASVFTYNLYSKDHSAKAKLENVNVHGLKHEMSEWSYLIATTLSQQGDDPGDAAQLATDEVKNPFFGPINAMDLFNEFPEFDSGYPSYKGNILIDGYIASTKFLQTSANSFKYLGQQCVLNDILVDWATVDADRDLNTDIDKGENDMSGDNLDKRQKTVLSTLGNQIKIGCNMDVMNHAGKGTSGLRIDSVDDVILKNINIYDNHDSTPLGSTACGDYEESTQNEDGFTVDKAGHFRQTEPMQVGFSGNMNQGIVITASDTVYMQGEINIFDLTSDTGSVFGIAIWPNNKNIIVDTDAKISINNLEAGGSVDINKYEYEDRPNKAPEVCGILFYETYNQFTSTMAIDDSATINFGECLAGDVGCMGSDSFYQYSTQMENVEAFDTMLAKSQLNINAKNSDNGETAGSCQFRFENSQYRSYSVKKDDANVDSDNNSDNKDGEDEHEDRSQENQLFEFLASYANSQTLNGIFVACVVAVTVGLICIVRHKCRDYEPLNDKLVMKQTSMGVSGAVSAYGGVIVEEEDTEDEEPGYSLI